MFDWMPKWLTLILSTALEHTGAIATLLAATGAGVVAWRSISNRKQADIKAEWWRRVQYAIEKCYSRDLNEINLGLVMLGMLSSETPVSRKTLRAWDWNVTPDDRHFLLELMSTILDAVYDRTNKPDPEGASHEPGNTSGESMENGNQTDTLTPPERGDQHG